MELPLSPQTLAFIRLHRTDDVRTLALQARPSEGVDLTAALQQIAGWQVARRKLPRWSTTEGVLYPPHLPLEQCSSELTAAYKAEVLGGGESLTDLTGGFGVDCSYLAQGFTRATYVERQPELCALARHNLPLLGCPHVRVHEGEAEAFLDAMEPVDALFLDPARRDAHGGRTVDIADCTPDVAALHDRLLRKGRQVLVKLSPMLDITRAVQLLPGVRQVHVVSVHNECRELLFLLTDGPADGGPVFHCVNFAAGVQRYAFTSAEEQSAACPLAPAVGSYLYEPNASLLKAGAFRSPAVRFRLSKLHPNSHLYTSDRPAEGFPGRAFTVEAVSGFGKRELKALTDGIGQANLTVRNFPSTVAELRRRLKLREGGDIYLFATTLADGRKVIVKCKKAPNSSDETDRQ